MDLRAIGISAALGSAASWAIGSILFKRLGEQISPLAMTLAKGSVSVVLLSLALLATGYSNIDQPSLWLLILSGVLGIAFGDTFFFEALQHLTPHALVLLMMLGQVLTALFAVLFLQETPSVTVWLGILSVVVGVGVVLSANLSVAEGFSKRRGLLFGLLSVLCMSASIIIAKPALESTPTIQATLIRMLSGTGVMFGFGIATRRVENWLTPFKDFQLVGFFLAAVSVVTFGGFWLSLVAIKYVDVSIANTLNSTEPLFVLPLAAIFLKEKITRSAIVGTAIATLGIVLLCQG